MIPLREYKAPSTPADHALRNAIEKLKRKFLDPKSDTVLPGERLRRTTLELMNEVVDPPASGSYLAELGSSLQQWLAEDPAGEWLKVVVLPPCDAGNIIESWAREGSHEILRPPRRQDLLRGKPTGELDLRGKGLLVIPRLEHWFLRQRNGLVAVRSLLAQLALVERRCLIGCNSWAWNFLEKAAGADVLLPSPCTFPPFDAGRLHHWFAEMAGDAPGHRVTFRSARTGENVLATDQDGQPENGFLKLLAARSLGIPWVAWHLWRTSLRADDDADNVSERAAEEASCDEARTLWVIDVDDYRLPAGHEDRAMLVLQALLMHHALTAAELKCVLPETGEPDMMPALLAAGFVQREGELLSVGAAAYPAVRRALIADGCPVGPM